MGGYIPRGLLRRGVVAVADAVGHVKVCDVELVQLGREVHEGLGVVVRAHAVESCEEEGWWW